MDVYIKDPDLRQSLVSEKTYRLFSYVFSIVGFIVFIFLYQSYTSEGGLANAASFSKLLFLIIPFLPALALGWKARKLEAHNEQAVAAYFIEEERKKAEIKAAKENNIVNIPPKEEEGIVQFGPDGAKIVNDNGAESEEA